MADVETGRVEVVRWVERAGSELTDEPDDSADRMAPASPRHARPRSGLWQRVVTAGQEALVESSTAIAAQVDTVAERMVATLEQRQGKRQAHRAELGLPGPAWQVAEIEVSFGIQLTGETAVAIFSGSAETSAQIVLKFARSPSHP
jgi:Trypsin-co-occurring domain 1